MKITATNIDTSHDADALSVVLDDINPASVYCEDFGDTIRVCEVGTDDTLLTFPAELLAGDLSELAAEILRLLRACRENRDAREAVIAAMKSSDRATDHYADALLRWNAVISQ